MTQYIYSWGPRIKKWPADSPLKQLDRKGEHCRVLASSPRGKGDKNSALVEFDSDKYQAVVSRSALRRVRP